MNTPITWGDYFYYKLIVALISFALTIVLGMLGHWSASRYCRVCARPLQWRWRKPWQYASRRFCPYHDEGSPYP